MAKPKSFHVKITASVDGETVNPSTLELTEAALNCTSQMLAQHVAGLVIAGALGSMKSIDTLVLDLMHRAARDVGPLLAQHHPDAVAKMRTFHDCPKPPPVETTEVTVLRDSTGATVGSRNVKRRG